MIDYDFEGPPSFDDEEVLPASDEELREDAPLTTDSANAEAVVADHGKGYLFVHAWSRWLAWDGRRWRDEGADGQLQRSIVQAMRARWSAARARLRDAEERIQAAALKAQKDEDAEYQAKREKALLKWYEQSQNQSRIAACRVGMQAHLGVSHDRLDCQPMLLNVANGTIDLRNAELRPHAREDYLTKVIETEYHDDAKCPTWDAFMSWMMPEISTRLYLQRWAGYAATGKVSEQKILFLYGGGKNGKSTWTQTIARVLGAYSCSAPRELLFVSKGGAERHPTEIAALFGMHLAVCAEVQANAQLDEAKTKDLSGGDRLSARRMREDNWTFEPTHKLFLYGNNKPNISGSDDGIWRRICFVKCLGQITEAERDIHLTDRLLGEAEGILRWVVQGCLEWQRIGLLEPVSVVDATQEYREESDAIGRYLDERVVFGPDDVVPRVEIRKAYEAWCEEQGYMPLGARRFAQRLREHGVKEASKRIGTSVVNAWRGCRLKYGSEMTES
ncbi:MAG: primase [Labilithrix sp.]|nr:primase [Labilithrix sp.]